MPASYIYSDSASAIFLVRVVISTRWPLAAASRHSAMMSSTWVAVGRTMQSGSVRPVGRTTCSEKTPPVRSISQVPGVAETKMVCGRNPSHSSNFSGLLSMQLGSRKPYSDSVLLRAKSPLNMAPICGTVTWLSSMISSAFSGRYSNSVGGGSPGPRPDK